MNDFTLFLTPSISLENNKVILVHIRKTSFMSIMSVYKKNCSILMGLFLSMIFASTYVEEKL